MVFFFWFFFFFFSFPFFLFFFNGLSHLYTLNCSFFVFSPLSLSLFLVISFLTINIYL
ncbi:hypothetical protein EDC94DRAFT_612593, partial [Helicostylum pulchrum]